jgi:hypothetical protein
MNNELPRSYEDPSTPQQKDPTDEDRSVDKWAGSSDQTWDAPDATVLAWGSEPAKSNWAEDYPDNYSEAVLPESGKSTGNVEPNLSGTEGAVWRH